MLILSLLECKHNLVFILWEEHTVKSSEWSGFFLLEHLCLPNKTCNMIAYITHFPKIPLWSCIVLSYFSLNRRKDCSMWRELKFTIIVYVYSYTGPLIWSCLYTWPHGKETSLLWIARNLTLHFIDLSSDLAALVNLDPWVYHVQCLLWSAGYLI